MAERPGSRPSSDLVNQLWPHPRTQGGGRPRQQQATACPAYGTSRVGTDFRGRETELIGKTCAEELPRRGCEEGGKKGKSPASLGPARPSRGENQVPLRADLDDHNNALGIEGGQIAGFSRARKNRASQACAEELPGTTTLQHYNTTTLQRYNATNAVCAEELPDWCSASYEMAP